MRPAWSRSLSSRRSAASFAAGWAAAKETIPNREARDAVFLWQIGNNSFLDSTTTAGNNLGLEFNLNRISRKSDNVCVTISAKNNRFQSEFSNLLQESRNYFCAANLSTFTGQVEGAANLLGRLPPPFSFFGVSFSAGQSRSFRSASSTACARKKKKNVLKTN